MRKFLLLLLAFLAFPALGQNLTYPVLGTTANGNASGTIASTGVFQLLWSATGTPNPRHGCTIENNGSNVMYITEGLALGSSSTSAAVKLATGDYYYCTAFGTVLTGQINITGTSGDAFYAAQY